MVERERKETVKNLDLLVLLIYYSSFSSSIFYCWPNHHFGVQREKEREMEAREKMRWQKKRDGFQGVAFLLQSNTRE